MRCSVSAGHSPEQIKQIGRAFATQQQTVEEMQTA
jgi:hypothetical protein